MSPNAARLCSIREVDVASNFFVPRALFETNFAGLISSPEGIGLVGDQHQHPRPRLLSRQIHHLIIQLAM